MTKTNIQWTEETWNPVVGCSIISPGCTNCYAMDAAARRLDGNPKTPHYAGTTKVVNGNPVWTGKVAQAPDRKLLEPLHWKKPRTVFVNSMGDLFHEDVPDEWIDRVFAVMALADTHQFQVLTKRAERMEAYFEANSGPLSQIAEARVGREARRIAAARGEDVDHPYWDAFWEWPLPNVWLGVSAENQEQANARIPQLLATPAAVRFVSVEPMLGPVKLRSCWLERMTLCGECPSSEEGTVIDCPCAAPKLDWVICGGESRAGARPMRPADAEMLRDQCVAAGVPFFFKQWGEWMPEDYLPEAEAAATYTRDFHAGRTWRFTGTPMRRVGTKRAGRLLDGREWNEMPERPGAGT